MGMKTTQTTRINENLSVVTSYYKGLLIRHANVTKADRGWTVSVPGTNRLNSCETFEEAMQIATRRAVA